MKRQRVLTNKERGFVLLAGSLMLLFTIPMVGLAIDAGFMYVVKARLAAAADAAALAAARQLSLGQTVAAQEANAVARAQAFFAANYPATMYNTTNRTLSATVAETGFRTRTVTVTASVDAPVFFTRLLNHSNTTVVGTVGKASRRDVNVMMVLDRSGSMNGNGGCAAMRSAANAFVDLFAHERDVLGMITYGISYSLSYSPTKYYKNGTPTLPSKINSISCSGGTGISQALFQGYQQIVNLNEPGALNVILLFTDGIPNTVTANFPVNRLDTTRSADGTSLSMSANKRSRCYDYEHGRRYNYSGSGTPWSPSENMVYRGAIYAQEGVDPSSDGLFGIHGASTTNYSDAATITRPHQSPTSNTQYNSSGFETDCWHKGGAGAGTGQTAIQYDIAYYPSTDLYGTSMISDFKPLTFYPVSHVYANKISVNDKTNMMKAAINSVDNMGKRIRNNELSANINTVVYAVGLGEASTDQHALLRRVANDPNSAIYDNTKLEGLYVFAPVASDLNAAFVRIASEILRYAQ